MGNKQMRKGRVTHFNAKAQWGFIAENDTSQRDLFFGRSSLPYDAIIDRNTLVEFDLGVDRQNRPIATKVRPVNE
jgi:cold shock CspA family protein